MMPPLPCIRPMTDADAAAVRAIFAEGLDTGHASLEHAVPDWPTWDGGHHKEPRLVAEMDGSVVAWAALSPVSRRQVYHGVAEVSIYVAERARGQGVGRALLAELVAASEQCGYWTLQASIIAENRASLLLHEQAGFRTVGRRERIGQRDGIWWDTILLERRSRAVHWSGR